MLCFDLWNVIFIINKWDILYSEDDSSDEDEEIKIWNMLKIDIKWRWLLVREEFIFKMNLKDVIIFSKLIILIENLIINLKHCDWLEKWFKIYIVNENIFI